MSCPKCGSSNTSSFFRNVKKKLESFLECNDCGFEWNHKDNKRKRRDVSKLLVHKDDSK